MRLIIWGINFAPETVGIGPFNTVLADHLAAQGHDVEVVTSFTYYPHWKKKAADRFTLYRKEKRGSITVHRCWHYVPEKVTSFKRIIHEGTFVCLSVLRLLTLRQGDLLVVISPPLLGGAVGALVSFLRFMPYTVHIQDLQPDAAMGLGMLQPGHFANVLYWLEGIAYRYAAMISSISQPMVQAIRDKGVPPEKVVLFPNGVSLAMSPKKVSKGIFRARLNIAPETFLMVYSGNIGLKQGLDQIFEAARLLVDQNLLFVIAGDGAGRPHLERQVEKAGLPNVILLPLQAEEDYYAMLTDADLCLIIQEHGTGRFFLPSKLLKILALARPVLAVADDSSPLVKVLLEGQFGVWSPTNQPQILAEKIIGFKSQPERWSEFGEAGRRYVERFAFSRVLPEYEAALHRLIHVEQPLVVPKVSKPFVGG